MAYYCKGKGQTCENPTKCSGCIYFDFTGGYNETTTNADRIRAMSDAELADWLAMGAVTGACIKLGIAPAKKCIGICTKCIEEWLKQPERE